MGATGQLRHKEIHWQDPTPLAEAATRMAGIEFLRHILEGRLPRPPHAQLLAMRLVSVAPGEAVFACTPDEASYNPLGMVHGGWLCALMDSAAGGAVHTTLPAGVGYASAEIKVSFLHPIRSRTGEITVTGRALHVGGRVAFAESHARSAEGQLLGHATSTIAILRREPEGGPAQG